MNEINNFIVIGFTIFIISSSQYKQSSNVSRETRILVQEDSIVKDKTNYKVDTSQINTVCLDSNFVDVNKENVLVLNEDIK